MTAPTQLTAYCLEPTAYSLRKSRVLPRVSSSFAEIFFYF
jgi:hypothetical protein